MNVAELRNYFNVNNISGRADTDTHMNSAKMKNVSFNTERSTETFSVLGRIIGCFVSFCAEMVSSSGTWTPCESKKGVSSLIFF